MTPTQSLIATGATIVATLCALWLACWLRDRAYVKANRRRLQRAWEDEPRPAAAFSPFAEAAKHPDPNTTFTDAGSMLAKMRRVEQRGWTEED